MFELVLAFFGYKNKDTIHKKTIYTSGGAIMADKRNEVPQGLKRGVLSEDAVHMLLTDLVELSDKMEKLSKKIR